MPRAIKVAIIDNDRDQLELAERQLSPLGFQIRTFAEQHGILHLVKEWGPDAILCDLDLELLAGVSFAKFLVEKLKAKVILYSAADEAKIKAAAQAAGAHDWCSKSIAPNLLATRIRHLVGARA